MITEHKTVYRTSDGKLFVSEAEAQFHEDWNLNAEAIRTSLHTAIFLTDRRNFGDYVRADSPSFQDALINQLLVLGFRKK